MLGMPRLDKIISPHLVLGCCDILNTRLSRKQKVQPEAGIKREDSVIFVLKLDNYYLKNYYHCLKFMSTVIVLVQFITLHTHLQ